MSGESFSEAALQAALRDIRLPAVAEGGQVAELAAAMGLAGLAALLMIGLLRMVSVSRPRSRTPDLRERIAAARTLPEPERRVALLHLIKEHAPDRLEALAARLYRPGELSIEAIEAEVARFA